MLLAQRIKKDVCFLLFPSFYHILYPLYTPSLSIRPKYAKEYSKEEHL